MNPDVILKELTSLPTASAAEQRVIAWIEQWAEKNKLDLKRDRYGNLLISGPGAVKTNKPLLITAHMDHPAFVVNKKLGKNKVIGEFRGGVDKPYFVGSRVRMDADRRHCHGQDRSHETVRQAPKCAAS